MKNLRKLIYLITLLTLIMCLTGCRKSCTYDVTTGDKIKISIDTSNNYNMSDELPINFTKSDEIICQGTFAKGDAYDTYIEMITDNDAIRLIDQGSNKHIDYIFYEIIGENEYDYVIRIKKSNTCFVMGSLTSESDAKEVFNRLKFKVK